MLDVDVRNQDEKRLVLKKALESRTFARSEQLRLFLQFVCEAEFRGAKAGITEYVIGVEVLHRPSTYSPSEDSSVRTRAHELRQKLEKLYAEELPRETVRIIIPKGAYSPQFIRTSDLVKTLSVDVKTEAPPIKKEYSGAIKNRRKYFTAFLFITVVAAAAGFAIGTKVQKRTAERAILEPIVQEVWKQFAKPNDNVLLVAATPLYLVLGPATHQAYNTPIYPAPPEAYPLFREHRPLAINARLGMIFTKDALGVGSMNAVVIASNIIKALGGNSQILPERPAMMSVLHGRDAILFGAPVDSQVISELLEKTPLTVAYDEEAKEFVVRDRIAGRKLVPEKDAKGDFVSVYGLVTVLNTRDSDRGRLGLVIFSGITSVGTHGAAEYFTSPRALKALYAVFKQQGLHKFPAAYQVVVKCKFENMLLVSEEYHSHRILKED
jgi:hypothetical protein